MRKNRDDPIFVKRGMVRMSLDEYYRKDWLACDICGFLKRKDNKLRGGILYYDGDSCLKSTCTGILKTIK